MKYKNFDAWFADFIALEKTVPHCNAYNIRPLRVKYAISLLPEFSTLLKVKRIHVTGSSGKSSCAKIWGEFLFQQKFSVGVITKPHICNFNERYWCNGKLASEGDLLPLFEKVMEVNKTVSRHSEYGSLRYVEIMFLVGLLYFARLKLDYLVIEAGIGALYDYTNVFPNWHLGIITSVHNEHRKRLGGSIDSIIDHKVAVVNKSKIAYILEKSSELQLKIRSKINSKVEPFCINKEFDFKRASMFEREKFINLESKSVPLSSNIFSEMQMSNLASVIHYVDSLKPIKNKVEFEFNILGKFDTRQYNGRTLIFDTAHTPESVEDVVKTINKVYPDTSTYVFLAVTGRRKGHRMIDLIKKRVNKIYNVKLKIKGVPFKYYCDLGEQVHSVCSVQEIGFKEILGEVNKLPKNSIIIFTGSIYYIGEAMKKIQ